MGHLNIGQEWFDLFVPQESRKLLMMMVLILIRHVLYVCVKLFSWIILLVCREKLPSIAVGFFSFSLSKSYKKFCSQINILMNSRVCIFFISLLADLLAHWKMYKVEWVISIMFSWKMDSYLPIHIKPCQIPAVG